MSNPRTDQFAVRQPIVNLCNERGHADCIDHLARRVTEVELSEVARQVLDRYVVVRSVEAALQLREEEHDSKRRHRNSFVSTNDPN